MTTCRALFILALLIAITGTPLAAVAPAAAQGNADLQVWFFRGDETQLARVEYRDAAGNVLAWYALASDAMTAPMQASGILTGYDMEAVPVFDPYTATIRHYVPEGMAPQTNTVSYGVSQGVPSPNGTFAYSVTKLDTQAQTSAESWLYVATPGQNTPTLITQITSADAWVAVQPFGWDTSGTRLLVSDMPQGIGGYILFWTYGNVRVYDINSGAVRSLGPLSGYSDDVQFTALVQSDGNYQVTGIQITNTATGQISTYALPAGLEPVATGGAATFAPDNSKVAYQVARQNPEQEKFYTIVLDLASGQSRVVLEDEAVGYDTRYGTGTTWLDNTTLVVGDAWTSLSAVVDATSGTLLREENGAFLGYADGITSAQGFAPSGTAYSQCPDAPPSRLAATMRGRITYTDGTMTNVRYWAGLDADLAGQMAEGSTFTVLYGPTCLDGYAWWNLQFDSGLSGYVAEGTSADYYLEPWQ